MLEAVSCWYVDWVNIGSWVGGIGGAAAAIVAIWSVKRQQRERREFAKFLLNGDLDRLEGVCAALTAVESSLSMYDHPREEQRVEARRYVEDGLLRCSELTSQCEYFGHSEQQFHYRPQSKEFSWLARQATLVTFTPKAIAILLTSMKVPEPAMAHARNTALNLKSAIDAWKASGQGNQ